MFKRNLASLVATSVLVACAPTRQIALDYPSKQKDAKEMGPSSLSHQFEPISGFKLIDGDDYYIRFISEFDFKGESVLKDGCSEMSPNYENGDLTSSLIFNIRNDALKFKNETTGFLYQATTGKCNYKFEAKKTVLTPWMRLDSGIETLIDYSFVTSANSEVNMNGVAGDVTAASNLLALTGVGVGVAAVGQIAGQWAKNSAASRPASKSSVKQSSESHSLATLVDYSAKKGVLNQVKFQVYSVAEGGLNVLGAESQNLGDLKVYPEITPSLLLKTTVDGVPDARNLSLEEIGYLPSKSTVGEVKLAELIEDSKNTNKPNLKPDWNSYADVEVNCRTIKLMLKDLGFNKFDRNAFLFYFLKNSPDWLNYNKTIQQLQIEETPTKTVDIYKSKSFGSCLLPEDYDVMKSMGLQINLPEDWQKIQESGHKKDQILIPLKSIERQFSSVLTNPNKVEVEQQLYPLIHTDSKGDGTVLLQNYLGEFGLDKMLLEPRAPEVVVDGSKNLGSTDSVSSINTAIVEPIKIPGEGLVITAHQLANVISVMAFSEFSCARFLTDHQGQTIFNDGILLFTTRLGSPRSKGGAIEFEFSSGKINRIAFQLSTYKDFEQDVLSHPAMGGCAIKPEFINQLH
ncbi:MAG: hypothetical protein NTY69_07570 [Methylococcales bacterium]|nr:hypothetical protein [Methylococcales bacterium]